MIKPRFPIYLGRTGEQMLNDALRLMRVFYDIPQRELAARLQIGAPYLSEIEAGKKQPTLQLLQRYAEVFKMPLSSIMFFAEHIGDGTRAAKIKAAISSKVLALLNFIAERSDRDVA
jgi:transcriptional regulator with XRE-family HTH domain